MLPCRRRTRIRSRKVIPVAAPRGYGFRVLSTDRVNLGSISGPGIAGLRQRLRPRHPCLHCNAAAASREPRGGGACRDALMSYVDAALAPQRKTGQIKLHGPAAFEGMRKAGRLVAECLDMLADEVRPGVPTEKIDRLVFDFAMAHNATPATMMYRGYRKATCTSVNHVVCHGIPGEKPLKEGDIVNVDVTLILDGWHGDSSRMFARGRHSAPRRTPDRGHLRSDDARHRGDPSGRHHRRHRRRHPGLCRGAAHERGARLLRPRPRPAVPRRAQHRAYRPPGRRHRAASRHVLHGRADDQSRPPAREGAVRRLDRRDARPLALRAVRAHRRR